MILLTGASATGKTEVARIIKQKYNVVKVITHTTRKMRLSEIQDVDYHFVDKKTFEAMKENNEFVETTFYNGNYYGTSYKELGPNKIVIVDPSGLRALLALNEPSIIPFRLTASSVTRFNRMVMRGDDLEQIKIRLEKDEDYFSDSKFKGINYTIDTETKTIEEVADSIYSIYSKTLAK